MTADEPATPPPNPLQAKDSAQFIERLIQLRRWAGAPSLRKLRALGGQTVRPSDNSVGDTLPESTVSAILAGKRLPTLPRLDFVEALVGACLEHCRYPADQRAVEVRRWVEAWRRLSPQEEPENHSAPAPPPGQTDSDEARPNTLPYDIGDFTGRQGELDDLVAELATEHANSAVVVSAIDGMAGVGKTAFAVHRPCPTRQDPRRTRRPGGHVAGPHGQPARALIVLDNAASVDQVRPLLPGAAGCLVLVTSRRRLTDLEAAHLVMLDVLSHSDATALFVRIVGEQRCHAEPDAIDEAVSLCGHLPLAIRIAASRLRSRPAWTVTDLVGMLRSQRHRPSVLGDNVAAAFNLSYRYLDADQQRLFRILSLHSGPDIDPAATAALARIAPGTAERLLEELLDANLLQQHTAWRYRFHDLVREYARDRAAADESHVDRDAAVRGLALWYLHTTDAANQILMRDRLDLPLDQAEPPCPPLTFPTREKAFHWCQTELPNLVATTRQAFSAGEHAVAWKLPAALWGFFYLSRRWIKWITTYRIGLSAAREATDRYGEALMLHGLGTAHWMRQNIDNARKYYEQALAIWPEIGYLRGEARTLNNLGATYCGTPQRLDFERARDYFQRSLEIRTQIGDRRGQAQALNNLGELHREDGRYRPAIELLNEALQIYREAGDEYGQGHALNNLGEAYRQSRRFPEALEHLKTALELRRRYGGNQEIGETLCRLGNVYIDMGQSTSAHGLLHEAMAIFEDLEDAAQVAEIRGLIALTSRQ